MKTPQLPDLNTIEYLWRELRDQLENCNIKNKESGRSVGNDSDFSNTKINRNDVETSAGSHRYSR